MEMHRIQRQMLSFAQGFKSDLDFSIITEAINGINDYENIPAQDIETAFNYLVSQEYFKPLDHGKYEIMPKAYEFK